MEYPLQFGRQTWKPRQDGELILFLPPHERRGISFDATFEFVPPWLEDEDSESEHRTMRLVVDGAIAGLKDWRELVGFVVEAQEDEDLGEKAGMPIMRGEPEIEIWSSGRGGAASIHTHARDGWETRVRFEEMAEDEPYTFVCEVEAFFPSERARKAAGELFVKELFGVLDFDDEEKAKLLEEGWRFRYRGRVRLDELYCKVPLNTDDPIGWAQRMAERELGMKRFGFSRVSGGGMDGSFKPEDGVSSNSNERLVLLAPPTAWFDQWQQRQQEKKRKQDDERQGNRIGAGGVWMN